MHSLFCILIIFCVLAVATLTSANEEHRRHQNHYGNIYADPNGTTRAYLWKDQNVRATNRGDYPRCEHFPWKDPSKAPAMLKGQQLERGQFIESREAMLIMQPSGDLQLIRKKDTKVLWHTNTNNGTRAVFDGQLYVVDKHGGVIWNTPVGGGYILQVQHDCNMVIYATSAYTQAVWSSSTQMCIKVHIVPHEHCDVGWLLTPERYADGCRSPGGGVDGTLNTVMQCLMEDSNRTNTWVESYYFHRWWIKQNSSMQADVKKLVKNGQLTFTNGGWSMHDEACVHQESAIANMEVGAQFIKEIFGDDGGKLNIGWHIDPFGHASTTPRIMAQMGFDAFFFWRQDDQQRQYDMNRHGFETMWLPSRTLGGSYGMFTSIMYNNYCEGCGPGDYSTSCPGGFCCYTCEVEEEEKAAADEKNSKGFDSADDFGAYEAHTPRSHRELHEQRRQRRAQHHADHFKKSAPLMITKNRQSLLEAFAEHFGKRNGANGKKNDFTDVDRIARMFGANRRRRSLAEPLDITLGGLSDSYAQMVKSYAGSFRTNHVLIPWGCDFAHDFAYEDYPLMDKIIKEINANPDKYGMELFYSSPHKYVEEVASFENDVWPSNNYDYFVYADSNHSYWSGYFSSRAEYKGYERWLMNNHRAAETVYALGKNSSSTSTMTHRINEAKKDDAYESLYQYRQAMGVAQHHDSITGTERTHVRNRYQKILDDAYSGAQGIFESDIKARLGKTVKSCPLANLSVCAETQALANNEPVDIVIFNPLGQIRDEIITIPVPVKHITVLADGAQLPVQVVPTWRLTKTVDHTSPVTSPAHLYQAYVSVSMPALGYKSLKLVHEPSNVGVYVAPNKTYNAVIANDFYELGFDKSAYGVAWVRNKMTNIKSALGQTVGHYCPHSNEETDGSSQASGAYILRTCESFEEPKLYADSFTSNTEWLIGPLCAEVRQVVSTGSNIQQAWRLCKGFDYVELTNGIGELETLTNGVEVVQRLFVPSMATDSTWYTDSEGLELQKRVRNSRPNYPYQVVEFIGSNFFPCNAFATINESSSTSDRRMGIVMDRSRAMTSLSDGELQMLIHRRLLYDDGRGVGQALDARVRVLSTSRLIFHEKSDDFMAKVRLHSLRHTHYPVWFASSSSGSSSVENMKKSNNLPVVQAPSSVGSTPSLRSALLPLNVHLHALTYLWDGSLLVRLQHLFDRSEGPLSTVATVVLQNILPSSIVSNADDYTITETDILGVAPLSNMKRLPFQTCTEEGSVYSVPPRMTYLNVPKGVLDSVMLRPMELRTFIVAKKN